MISNVILNGYKNIGNITISSISLIRYYCILFYLFNSKPEIIGSSQQTNDVSMKSIGRQEPPNCQVKKKRKQLDETAGE